MHLTAFMMSPLPRGWGCMHLCVCRGWQQKQEIQGNNKLGIEAASMYVDNWSLTLHIKVFRLLVRVKSAKYRVHLPQLKICHTYI